MNLTYISHSGFLVEWDRFYTLFDWWKGELPPLRAEKPLLVFASHNHEDHFDPQIFRLPQQHDDTRFILSHDIHLATRRWEKLGLNEEIFRRITFMRADSVYTTETAGEPITVRTVRSTDAGVAFLVSAEGRLVFHAGDLNWWHWTEEGKAYCSNMAANYRRAVARLSDAVRDEHADAGCDAAIDAAMVPMDPRLEDGFDMGAAYLCEQIPVKRLFPMHMWEKYDWIERYCRVHPDCADRVARIRAEGDEFQI